MKILSTILILFISLSLFAQNDSANLRPSVTLQGRDIQELLSFTGEQSLFDEMDSVFISKQVGSSPVVGTSTTAMSSIKAKHWFAIYEKVRSDAYVQDQGMIIRLRTALDNAGHSWLAARLSRLDNYYQSVQQSRREFGRKRARKENDDQ